MKRLFLSVLISLCALTFLGCAHRQVTQAAEQPQAAPAAKSEAPVAEVPVAKAVPRNSCATRRGKTG